MDTRCYTNNDIQRKEVRLEFGWFPAEKSRLNREDIDIRMETKDDWYNVELMTQHAFWNKHHPGCVEQYMVHKLRQDKDYLPELSRIAVKNGEVIGCIMYSKARIVDGPDVHGIITFGPLYDLGSYPGIKENRTDKVKGELYEIDLSTLHRLNCLEGEGILYKLIDASILVGNDNAINANVYEYLGDVESDNYVPFDNQP